MGTSNDAFPIHPSGDASFNSGAMVYDSYGNLERLLILQIFIKNWWLRSPYTVGGNSISAWLVYPSGVVDYDYYRSNLVNDDYDYYRSNLVNDSYGI